MARTSGKGYGRNNVVATGSDSGDQVSVNAWNDDKDAGGMLGFTSSTKTISSGAITPIDTATVVAAEAGTTDNLDFITYSDTMENDILYLFADAGDTITVRHNQSPGAGKSAIITTSAASVTLSETVPLVLQRRSTTFYQIIENSISSVTAGSTTTFTNKSIDLTDNTLTGTSAELATAISDETGSGALVFGTSPTLVTPALGTPASGVATNITGLPIVAGTTGTLSVARGGTGVTTSTGTGNTVLSTSPTLVTPVLGTPASGTLTNCTFPTLNQSTTGTASNVTGTVAVATGGTGSTTTSAARTALGVAIGSDVQAYNSATALTTNKISDFAASTSAELAGKISDETGSGLLVFGTSPTLVTPALGIPASGTLTNCTGLPITGITSSTSAEIATLCSDETGSGSLVFATSPTFVTPVLGTPASGALTNCTALPAAQVTAGTLQSGMTIPDPTLTFSINAQTGTTYTPVLADAGKIVTLNNGSAITLTIPPNSSVAYPVGSSLTFINIGAGLTTFAQGSGVTIASSGGTATAPSITAQHNSATAIKIATDTWQVIGAIE